MTWARLDDRFHEHRKVKSAWHVDPGAVGLHVVAITYCAGHETDGLVDVEFVREKLPRQRDRDRLIGALVNAGLWEPVDDGWLLHDFLDYNPSKASLDEKRARDAERKARGRRTQSERTPHVVRADTTRSPNGVHAASGGPDPTRPDPTTPSGALTGTHADEHDRAEVKRTIEKSLREAAA